MEGNTASEHICLNERELEEFRTKQCPLYIEGHCANSTRCNMSHSETWPRRNPTLYKYEYKLCPNIQFFRMDNKMQLQGKCNYGRRCRFSHSKEEQLYHPDLYKTRFCVNFPNCKGYYCPFVHDQDEMRPQNSNKSKKNNKSKTKSGDAMTNSTISSPSSTPVLSNEDEAEDLDTKVFNRLDWSSNKSMYNTLVAGDEHSSWRDLFNTKSNGTNSTLGTFNGDGKVTSDDEHKNASFPAGGSLFYLTEVPRGLTSLTSNFSSLKFPETNSDVKTRSSDSSDTISWNCNPVNKSKELADNSQDKAKSKGSACDIKDLLARLTPSAIDESKLWNGQDTIYVPPEDVPAWHPISSLVSSLKLPDVTKDKGGFIANLRPKEEVEEQEDLLSTRLVESSSGTIVNSDDNDDWFESVIEAGLKLLSEETADNEYPKHLDKNMGLNTSLDAIFNNNNWW